MCIKTLKEELAWATDKWFLMCYYFKWLCKYGTEEYKAVLQYYTHRFVLHSNYVNDVTYVIVAFYFFTPLWYHILKNIILYRYAINNDYSYIV